MSCTRHRAAAGRPFQALAPQKGPGTLLARSPFRPLPYTLALAMLAGFALGAIAVERLHAQVKPKAYTAARQGTEDRTTLRRRVHELGAASTAAPRPNQPHLRRLPGTTSADISQEMEGEPDQRSGPDKREHDAEREHAHAPPLNGQPPHRLRDRTYLHGRICNVPALLSAAPISCPPRYRT